MKYFVGNLPRDLVDDDEEDTGSDGDGDGDDGACFRPVSLASLPPTSATDGDDAITRTRTYILDSDSHVLYGINIDIITTNGKRRTRGRTNWA